MKHNSPTAPARLTLVLAFALPAAHAANTDNPTLVRTPPGQVYMADGGRIFQIDTAQQRLRAVTPDIAARNLKVDGQSNLHASSLRYDPRTDLYRPMTWRYNPGSGVSETKAAPAGGEFVFSEVADPEGNLYFWHVDPKRQLSRVLVRPKGGEPILLAGHHWGMADGKGADARFSRLGGMTVGPRGNLFVCDEQSVRCVTRDGAVTTLARGGQLSLGAGRSPSNHLAAITADADGNLYIADRVTGRILLVTADGAVSTLSYTAEEWDLASLAWADGALYVLESSGRANRVVRVTPDGQRQELPRSHPPLLDKQPAPLRLSDNGDANLRPPFLPMFFMPVSHPLWLF